jgi:uncharacterized membrane protein
VTLLVMLGLLMLPYVLLAVVPGLRDRPHLRGCFGIALLFTFTGLGHFLIPQRMAEMIPPMFPYRVAIIYVTGVIEIAAGWLVLPERTRRVTGWLLILMLAGLLPFNIYSAIERVPMGGHEIGPKYLLIRIPVQLVIMAWCYWFAIRHADVETSRRSKLLRQSPPR